MVWSENGRLATYYVEYAAPPLTTQIYYDRANTNASESTKGDIDWEYLTDARILHLTGINFPLAPQLPDVVSEAIKQAKSKACW